MFKSKWWFIFFGIFLFGMGINQLAYWGEQKAGTNLHIISGVVYMIGALISLIGVFTKKFLNKK